MKFSFIDTLFNIVLPIQIQVDEYSENICTETLPFLSCPGEEILALSKSIFFQPSSSLLKVNGLMMLQQLLFLLPGWGEFCLQKPSPVYSYVHVLPSPFLSEPREASSEKRSMLAIWQSLKTPGAEMDSGSVEVDCLGVVAGLTCSRKFSSVFGNPVRAWSLGCGI